MLNMGLLRWPGLPVLKLDLPESILSALETQPPNHILLKQPSSVRKETDILAEIE